MSLTIESIHIKNVFSHKDTFISFKEGVNYLIGSNESGKTVILEMISYSLFGTSVLRSEATDYKGSDVTLTIFINKIKYIIHRTSKTTLYKTYIKDSKEIKEPLVTGITPVNKYIIELLGYDSSVYYKTNYSTQLEGHVHAIAKKSDRLALINKVNGIEEATKLEKYLDTCRRSIKSELKGLDLSSTFTLNNWVEDPVMKHLTPEDLNTYTKSIEDELSTANYYSQQLSALSMLDEFKEQEELDSLSQETHRSLLDDSINLDLHSYLEELKVRREEYMKQKEHVQKLELYIKSNSIYIDGELVSEKYVSDLESKQEENKAYSMKEQLKSEGDIECPHCSTSFPLLYKQIDEIEGGNQYYELPSTLTIKSYRRFVDLHLNTILTYKKELEELKLIHFDLNHFQEISNKADRYKVLTDKKIQIETQRIKYNSIYTNQLSSSQLKTNISICTTKIEKYKNEYEKLDKYLRSKEVYETTTKLKEEIKNRIKLAENKINAYQDMCDKSKQLRLKIQNSCIPTLNKKASKLISKMTGGQHYSLCISDTFELLLDNNLLTKYSGSTQVISSVAFRIALIDTFYKKSFPLFIGDEIDSFADEDRASYIRSAFNTISNEYQLILISHFKAEDLDGNVIDINKCKKA